MRKVYIVMQKPSTEPPRIFKVFRRKKDAEIVIERLNCQEFKHVEHWIEIAKV